LTTIGDAKELKAIQRSAIRAETGGVIPRALTSIQRVGSEVGIRAKSGIIPPGRLIGRRSGTFEWGRASAGFGAVTNSLVLVNDFTGGRVRRSNSESRKCDGKDEKKEKGTSLHNAPSFHEECAPAFLSKKDRSKVV
jgi:hypothetical protein